MARSVTRALQAIKRYAATAEQIDHAVLSAINVTLFLASGGDERVSEGFNRDIAGNGRDFGRWVMEPAPISQALASPQNRLS
jgi:cell division protein ZapA (FtsZ GTPase activity inhibitor)